MLNIREAKNDIPGLPDIPQTMDQFRSGTDRYLSTRNLRHGQTEGLRPLNPATTVGVAANERDATQARGAFG
jgi:hypothetical protein